MADEWRTNGATANDRRGWFGRVWPLATTLVIFAAIFSRIPFTRLSEALSRADLVPFLALMAAFSLAFFAIDTLVLALAIRWFHGPLPYRDLLPVRASTYLVSLVNTQLAQGALALYLHRRFLTPLGAITGTVLVLILLEVTQLIVFATAGMLAFPGSAPASLLGVPAALALLWAALAVFVRRPARGALATHAVARTLRIATPRQLLALLGLKSTTFLLALVVHGIALSLFDIHIPWSRLLASLPIVFMVAALPITVAHLGTSQAAWIFFFRDYAPEASLLAYSLAAHLTFMLANGTLGLLFLPKAYADLVLRPRRDEPGGSRPSQKATSV
ncbi:MAG: lysylphosphatidylglycerol synthase domain-containing protein [Candidatus Binatia bacterium]